MALQAPAHFQTGHPGHLGHRFHLAVTVCAIHFCPNMGLVIEVNEPGQDIHFDPGNGLSPLPVPTQRLNAFSLGGYNQMATHAAFHRRDAGKGGAVRITMAVKALNLEIGHMDLVIERDGLIWRIRPLLREKPHAPRRPKEDRQGQQNKPRRFGHHTVYLQMGQGEVLKSLSFPSRCFGRTSVVTAENRRATASKGPVRRKPGASIHPLRLPVRGVPQVVREPAPYLVD